MRAGPRLPTTQPVAISREMTNASKWEWVQRHWLDCRPKLAAYWPRLPQAAVEQLSGDRASLVELVKERYALQQSGAEAQVDAWLAGISSESRPPAPRTLEEQRAEGEGMGTVPGATDKV
jgi:hypothetical protein